MLANCVSINPHVDKSSSEKHLNNIHESHTFLLIRIHSWERNDAYRQMVSVEEDLTISVPMWL